MLQSRHLVRAAVFGVLVFSAFRLLQRTLVHAQAEPRIVLNKTRGDESDLEVLGLSEDGPRYVARKTLEALPQAGAVVKRDENFTELPTDGVAIRGIDLDVLGRALGATATMVPEAVAVDEYAATYPSEYTKRHHPILVLRVEGVTPEAWAKKTHTSDLGPYFVAYDRFMPAFRVLSHDDRAQVPVQVVRLEFATEERMFAGILPGSAADLQATQGYRIAQQNCFRCHDSSGHGGMKSGRSWQILERDARERPDWFLKWVHDPQSVDPKSEMPPNLNYDRATLAALARYFSTMEQTTK